MQSVNRLSSWHTACSYSITVRLSDGINVIPPGGQHYDSERSICQGTLSDWHVYHAHFHYRDPTFCQLVYVFKKSKYTFVEEKNNIGVELVVKNLSLNVCCVHLSTRTKAKKQIQG